MSTEILAWTKEPEPKGTLFTAQDLANRENVIALFWACKLNVGYITADGWEYLFHKYGLSELLHIDLDIKWFDSQDLKSQTCDLIYESLIAGYNPIHTQKGDYDTETRTFLNLDGTTQLIDWDKIVLE